MLGSYELSLPKIKIVMRLSELGTGEKGVIVKVLGHGGFRKRIVEMGFIKGKTVEVLLNAPLKDPIKYKVLGYEISLRRQEAEMIEVVSEEEAKKLAEEMNVPLLGQIPIVQSICEGGDNGTPVALDEDTVTGRAFLSLAASVVRQVDRRNIEMAPTKIVEMHK